MQENRENRILVLGAGMVAGPLIRYLQDHRYGLTVTSLVLEDAVKLVGDDPSSKAMTLDLADEKTLSGLVAGAMSMAAGEYVSVSSQADTEKADLERERQALEDDISEFDLYPVAAIAVTYWLSMGFMGGAFEGLWRDVLVPLIARGPGINPASTPEGFVANISREHTVVVYGDHVEDFKLLACLLGLAASVY